MSNRITDHLNRDRKEKDEIKSHKVGRRIGDKLKLRKVNRRGVYHLIWDGPKVKKLCERYGILTDGVDFGGLEDFGDFYREPPRKSTGDDHGDHLGGDGGDQGGGDDFPDPPHRKSTKSTSLHPPPERCDGCSHFDQRWASCKKAARRITHVDVCPLR